MKKIPDRGTQWPSPASDGSTGVYGISVAAELAGMSVQALRLYERPALLEPARTGGGSRRYSDTDIARVLGLEADDADLNADNAGHCELSVQPARHAVAFSPEKPASHSLQAQKFFSHPLVDGLVDDVWGRIPCRG